MTEMYGTVVRTEVLGPRMVRVVLGGEGLAAFEPSAFTDQYVNALFPPADAVYDVPFDPEDARVRAQPPRGRRETVRRWNPDRRELTIDFVGHGDVGHAGPWSMRTKPGDRLQLTGPAGGYAPRPDADWHLLVGDESALPAIAAAVDHLPARARAIVVAIVDGPADRIELSGDDAVEVVWVHRADHPDDPDALLEAVRDLVFPPGTPHAFVHGEAGEVRAIRRHLLAERGVPREGQSISPYWRREHTDEQWREIKRQWLAESELDV